MGWKQNCAYRVLNIVAKFPIMTKEAMSACRVCHELTEDVILLFFFFFTSTAYYLMLIIIPSVFFNFDFYTVQDL